MKRLDLYKELYFAELKRKEDLRTALALPSGITTILGGVIAVYLREVGKIITVDLAGGFLMVATGLLVLSFIMTASHLIRSYHDWEYAYVPYATELEKAYHALVEYYRDQKADFASADVEFEASLIDRLTTAHEKNAYNNDSKSKHLHNANEALIYCLVIALLAAIPYFFRINERSTDVQKIEIVNPASEGLSHHVER